VFAITSASASTSTTSASTSTAVAFASELAVTTLATSARVLHLGGSVTIEPDARRKLHRPLTRPTERLP
jgi:hypothetical protein